MKNINIIFVFILNILIASNASALDTFPGCVGHGCSATCGAGATRGATSTVYYVNSLSCEETGSCTAGDSSQNSSCSLVDCINGSENGRYCLFQTAGVIDCTGETDPLIIANDYITIAGESAPYPGILLRGISLRIETEQVCVRHISLAPGDGLPSNQIDARDGIRIVSSDGKNVQDVVLDQLSGAWSADEMVNISNQDTTLGDSVSNLTISNSLFYQGLNGNVADSRGMLVGAGGAHDSMDNLSLIGNIFSHFRERMVKIAAETSIEIVNNLFYNYAINTTTVKHNGLNVPFSLDFVANYYENGPDEDTSLTRINFCIQNSTEIETASRIHAGVQGSTGNYCEDGRESDSDPTWDAVQSLSESSYSSMSRLAASSYSPLSASAVKSSVLLHAGARPNQRSAEDLTITSDIASGLKDVVIPECVTGCGTDEQAVPNWPARIANSHNHFIPSSPDGDEDSDGYTNIEELLHRYAQLIDNSCVNNFVLPAIELQDDQIVDRGALQTVETGGDFIVVSGSEVSLFAGTSVILDEGFEVEAGGVFSADAGVSDCGQS